MTHTPSAGLEPLVGRAAKIASIHALADWFAAHPEAPMPTIINADHYVFPDDEPDEATRVAGVLAVHRQLEMRSIEGDRTVQAELTILAREQHGMRIGYSVIAMKDERRAATYLEPRR